MAQSLVPFTQDLVSNENSLSTKEFLDFEKTCEAYKDSDEEIKLIFNEIKKLSGETNKDKVLGDDVEDVELILKRAEDIAQETQALLKSSPIAAVVNVEGPSTTKQNNSNGIPHITVTKPFENNMGINSKGSPNHRVNLPKQNGKENLGVRRKPKSRPFSAGVIDSKKREPDIVTRLINSPIKTSCKQHESLIEELKDTTERAKSLELLNVQLIEDNKALKKHLERITEEKHVTDLKLVESEKFISRIGKEYENRHKELNEVKENESKLLAELSKERNSRKSLTTQHEKDTVVIKDLQRQVKEMEMILKRKHPDSVSALIVASKSSTVDDNKKKLLEERIARLEQELNDKENHFQGILQTLQGKFGDMKQKYENHIIDVERQLMEDRKVNNNLKNRINKSDMVDAAVQTASKAQHTTGTQTFPRPDRSSSAVSNRLSQNSAILLNKLKEDSHLVATIKGLQAELTVKQRTISKINRETEELRKNLRNLQKEKEVLINLNPTKKINGKHAKSTESIYARLNAEMESELSELRQQNETLVQEKSSLLDSLKRTNEEFILLKKKRIQDLHTLQLAHEKELMQMNMHLYPLQEEIRLLNRTIEILQERLRNAEDKLVKYQTGVRDVDINAGGDNHLSRGKREVR